MIEIYISNDRGSSEVVVVDENGNQNFFTDLNSLNDFCSQYGIVFYSIDLTPFSEFFAIDVDNTNINVGDKFLLSSSFQLVKNTGDVLFDGIVNNF
ncbi:hypothetical protein [Persephonella sp.]